MNGKNANSVNDDIAAEVVETNHEEPSNSFKEKLVNVEKDKKNYAKKLRIIFILLKCKEWKMKNLRLRMMI